jgi:5'-3' exoribonuclease 2
MGVPSLFRWLSQKYPKILDRVKEEMPVEVDGVKIPVDATKPNPNGEEFDHLYLDMNGIVHPCSHPEDKPPPETEEEMMVAVFEYTDRVIRMVRPRKLLMIAVDGVAPRAKMNQQRQRRFRSVKEAKEKAEQKEEFDKLLKAQNGRLEATEPKKAWDSNVITPGTPFMAMLAECLQYWVQYKLATDAAWRNLKIIISDASVPGEGEHKIMEFIRSQRSTPGYNPNTRHVIYGLDADLIMLALATHEPHFRVLREDVFFNKDFICHRCNEPGHNARACPGPGNNGNIRELLDHNLKPFMWLHVSVLREYLKVEMDSPGRKFQYDLERALDDWVFMCFFVGNDFLPHLPSLEINENGIDTLLDIWRNVISLTAGYVTKHGLVHMRSVEMIMKELAKKEANIFVNRKWKEDQYQARMAKNNPNKAAQAQKRPRLSDNGTANRWKRVKETAETYANVKFFDPKEAQSAEVRAHHHDLFINRTEANKSAAAVIKEKLRKEREALASQASGQTTAEESASTAAPAPVLGKRTASALEETDTGTPGRATPVSNGNGNGGSAHTPPEDTVQLWEQGYQDRYYTQKFGIDASDKEFRHQVARDYAVGLCWVLQYYMQGCPDWTWYYPYHYPPFAEDFVNVQDVKPQWSSGKPFQPYQQLMGVLPAASRHAVPAVYHSLMTDSDSEIIDFYPEDFKVDLNGAKQAWKGVALLPFIQEERLKKAMAPRDKLLTEAEDKRNRTGKDFLIFHNSQPMFAAIMKAWNTFPVPNSVKLDPAITGGLNGEIESDDKFVIKSTLEFPLQTANPWPDIPEQPAVRVLYIQPTWKKPHKSVLLEGVELPPTVLTPDKTDALQRHAKKSFTGNLRPVPDDFVYGPEYYQWPKKDTSGLDVTVKPVHEYPPVGIPRPNVELPDPVNVEALFPEFSTAPVNKEDAKKVPVGVGAEKPIHYKDLSGYMAKVFPEKFPGPRVDSYKPTHEPAAHNASAAPRDGRDNSGREERSRGYPQQERNMGRDDREERRYDDGRYNNRGRGRDSYEDDRRGDRRDGGRGGSYRDENWSRRDDREDRRDYRRYDAPARGSRADYRDDYRGRPSGGYNGRRYADIDDDPDYKAAPSYKPEDLDY